MTSIRIRILRMAGFIVLWWLVRKGLNKSRFNNKIHKRAGNITFIYNLNRSLNVRLSFTQPWFLFANTHFFIFRQQKHDYGVFDPGAVIMIKIKTTSSQLLCKGNLLSIKYSAGNRQYQLPWHNNRMPMWENSYSGSWASRKTGLLWKSSKARQY